ncbi:MAG TPA: hypothetical protein VF695_13830, partial [Sphingomonas sp.]|jgi:hypothetical protein
MANGALIGALRVTLGLDSASFESGMTRAERTATQSRGRMETAFRGIGSAATALKGALVGLGAGFVISGLQNTIADALDYASSLGEVAQQLGVTTRTLQEYRYAATQLGIDQEVLDKGLAKLTLSIGQAAAGSKKQEAAFRALGVSIRDANGAIRTTDDVLPDLIASLSEIPPNAKRAGLEVAIFGKAGQELDTLLHGGTEEINRLRDAAQSLGVVLSDEQIANADQTADKLAELKMVLEANIAGTVANNAAAIYDLANSFTSLAARALSAWQQMSNWENLQIARSPMLARLSRLQGGPNQEQARQTLMGNQSGRRDLFMDARRDYQNAKDPTARAIAFARAKSIHDEEMRTRVRTAPRAAPSYNIPDADAPKTGGGGGRARGGSGGGAARSGPSLVEQTRLTMDRLFPDQAQRRELEERMALLGKALAAKVLNPVDYERARDAITRQVADLAPEVQRLLDQVAPEQAQVRELEQKIADLDRGMAAKLIDPIVWEAARNRLREQLREARDAAAKEAANADPIQAPDLAPMTNPLVASEKEIEDRYKGIITANDNLKASYLEMAQDVSGALQGLASDIRSGDWLSVLQGTLDLLLQLAGSGAFGGKMQTTVRGNRSRVPGFSTGGSFTVGGASGVDTNLIAFRATRGEMVDIRRPGQQTSGGGIVRLMVEENPMFRPVIRSEASNVSVQTVTASNRTAAMRQRQALG